MNSLFVWFEFRSMQSVPPQLWYSCWCKEQLFPVLENSVCVWSRKQWKQFYPPIRLLLFVALLILVEEKKGQTFVWEKSHSSFLFPKSIHRNVPKNTFRLKLWEQDFCRGTFFQQIKSVKCGEREILKVKALGKLISALNLCSYRWS